MTMKQRLTIKKKRCKKHAKKKRNAPRISWNNHFDGTISLLEQPVKAKLHNVTAFSTSDAQAVNETDIA